MNLLRRLRNVKITDKDVNYTAIAFGAMRKTIPPGMNDILKENGDFEDLLQDMRLAAVEAADKNMSPKEAYNLSCRTAYAGMRACGYFRESTRKDPKGRWHRRTTKLDFTGDN